MLLAEYRELGALLETGRAEAGAGETAAGMTLSARHELLRQRFETSRESFLRYYRNAAQDQPYETADYYVRQVRSDMGWTRGVGGGGGGLQTGHVPAVFFVFFVTSVKGTDKWAPQMGIVGLNFESVLSWGMRKKTARAL